LCAFDCILTVSCYAELQLAGKLTQLERQQNPNGDDDNAVKDQGISDGEMIKFVVQE